MDSEFEQRLRRLPLKPIPGEWRAEILTATREAQAVRPSSFVIRHSWLSTLLWPHPMAWAGLAAAWLVIMDLNFSMRDRPAGTAARALQPAPEVVVELRQQQKMLAELIGPVEVSAADRQRVLFPRPRSERMEIVAA